MLRIISLLIATLCTLQSVAQSKNDYNWIITKKYNTDIAGAQGYQWKFTDDGLVREYLETPNGIFRQITSMSDVSGNLQFYCNACEVYNSNHELMENGDGINDVSIEFDQFCPEGYPGSHNMISLPDPANENGYYILHKPISNLFTKRLLYTYIDMSMNNGLGAVEEKNVNVYNDSDLKWGHLNATKHANGKDWWVTQLLDSTNVFLKFLIDENGINLVGSQAVGPELQGRDGSVTQVVYNRDGSKYAIHSLDDYLLIYDFNRSTGELTFKQRIVLIENIPFQTSRGAMFSPNNRFLYANTESELYQIDMWEEDLNDGVELIAAWDGFVEETVGVPVKFGNLTHGPDCKIYMSSPAGIQYMHMIEYPDEKGEACGFKQHSIKLDIPAPPLFSNIIPFFRMDESAPCDPTLVGLADVYGIGITPYKIYPNPVSDLAILESEAGAEIVKYELLSVDGQVLLGADIDDKQTTIDMSRLVSGMYFLRVYDVEGAWEVEKVVKE